MRASQVPLGIHWDVAPGRVEVLLKQEVGTHLPWVELALALVVLVAIAEPALLVPAGVAAVLAVAVGVFYERRARARRPALVRLDWEARTAEVTHSDGHTATHPLEDPGYAHAVRLRGTVRTAFATGWERPGGQFLLVRHPNRSEATNFLRDLARAGWPVHRDEVDLS